MGDRVVAGRIVVAGDSIDRVEEEEVPADAPYICPGLIDVHVHGWGGFDATRGHDALDGMATALLAHGVTSFLPTADAAPLTSLERFADDVRRWTRRRADDRSEPLGFNLEGPFLSREKAGAQDPRALLEPATVDPSRLAPLVEGSRVMTVAPEVRGGIDLIRWLVERDVVVSLGHSAALAAEATAGFEAGATSTTHLFNAMSGIDHRTPGLAAVALAREDTYVELIADGHHVDPVLWQLVFRAKPRRVALVSDAVPVAGVGEGRAFVGGQEVEVRDGRCTLVDGGQLAGSVIALDTAVRNLVMAGIPITDAVHAATAAPADLLGLSDRGRIAPGSLADLVEFDENLNVRRVMKRGRWVRASTRSALSQPDGGERRCSTNTSR